MTNERDRPRDVEAIAQQIFLRIGDRFMLEKPPKLSVRAAILWGAAALLGLGFVLTLIGGAEGGWSFRLFSYALLIALTNNVDNLGARIAYSLQGTRVGNLVNFWISVITFAISYAAAYAGAVAVGYLDGAASVVAMVFLVALGAWMILQARGPTPREEGSLEKGAASFWTVLLQPHRADVDRSKHIDFKEGTMLGIALSINNIGGGLSGGILGVNPFLVALLSAFLSFVALWAGNYIAEFFVERNLTEKAAIVGGALLIAIGIKQVF